MYILGFYVMYLMCNNTIGPSSKRDSSHEWVNLFWASTHI